MLTDITIRKLLASPPPKRVEHADGKVAGLFFITQPSGATSWALRYRADSASRKLTLGSFPALDLKTARRKAEEARGAIAKGEDPAAAKTAAREAAKAEREAEGDLVENVVSQFIERYAKTKTRDWRETERLLKRNVVERWPGKCLREITKPMVHAMLDAIADRGSPIAANRVLAQLKVMCKWAVGRGIISASPCDGVSAPSSERGRARERVLSDEELRLVWKAADSIGWPFGPIVKLLALTGARRDEVAQMEWREIDFDRALWTLPVLGARTGASMQFRYPTRRWRSFARCRGSSDPGLCSRRTPARPSPASRRQSRRSTAQWMNLLARGLALSQLGFCTTSAGRSRRICNGSELGSK